MKPFKLASAVLFSLFLGWTAPSQAAEAGIYGFRMQNIDGHTVNLARFKGKVLLVVNVASKCGNTPQYKPLEEAYQKYHSRGFEVLAFPANDFKQQEPGTNGQIKEFCEATYHVKFPLFSKITVKGQSIHPLYKYLTQDTAFKGDIEWNFAKFLVDRAGNVVDRYSMFTKPEKLETRIVSLLNSAASAPVSPRP